MREGLQLARPRRRRRWLLPLAGLLVLLATLPRLAALCPAGARAADTLLADRLVPGYTARLQALEAQNARLHRQLAQAQEALAENQALRSFVGCGRTDGSWQPARVVARLATGVTLACDAPAGTPVLDPQGRYAGRVTGPAGSDCCQVLFAGSEKDPCAGLAGECAGLLERGKDWVLTGLPADSALAAGTAVTTPGGYWLGALAQAPQTDANGLTARAPLTDIAELNSTVFFVKND